MKVMMLYDGFCVLCQQTQRVVKVFDWFGRVERLNAQDTELIHTRFPELEGQDILGEIFVRSNSGEWLVGFFGMRYLAWQIPLGWLLLPLLYLPTMNWVGPRVYAWVAKRRYAINKLVGNECFEGACKIDFSARQKI